MARTTARREAKTDMTVTNLMLGVVALLLVVVIALLAVGLPEEPEAATTAQASWEYKIVSPDDAFFDTEMNLMGKQGWELVTARRASGPLDSVSYEMIFKRPRD